MTGVRGDLSYVKWAIVYAIALIIVLIFYRLSVQMRVHHLKRTSAGSEIFRKKVDLYTARVINGRHIMYLMLINFLMTIVILCLAFLWFYSDNERQILAIKLRSANESIQQLLKTQDANNTVQAVVSYPKEGLSLEQLNWEGLFSEDTSEEKKSLMESVLFEETRPYFGETTVLLTVNQPAQTISVTLQNHDVDSKYLDTLHTNFDAFVAELEQVAQIEQVDSNFVSQESQEENRMLYVRNDENRHFEVIN